ncbi:GGDEF domain-containing protein [Alteromonas sediminis]|uniref:diguanylate cyclase n=1 Tax=Alteromonas sediminis TaxID=2259342 RepID=A0A3N5Z7K2_9ALTE|nr:GGDEF domain-containing protein [Alteromonas sediminis]RPJ64808.1 GGDEF domain-containing protein [Alteromonas sediminis]
MHPEQTTQLHFQALFDLTMRAKAGIFIYLAVWVVFVVGFDFWANSPMFVMVNSGLILFMFVARLIHLAYVKRANKYTTDFLYQLLIGFILLSASHWGVMSAFILIEFKDSNAYQFILIVLAALAMGGASALSISNTVRYFYPLALYAPAFFVFFIERDPLSTIYGICMLLSYAYVIAASKYSRDNYWSAIRNHLIAEERASELEKLSTTDQLTQLKNRMYFDAEFEQEWSRSFRLKSPMSVIMLDFDHFKSLNDTYGHLFGDEVLRQASSLISNELKRPTDCIARYGGEEFVALLPNTDASGARTLGERLRKAVESMALTHQGKPVTVTCSVGGASAVPSHDIEKTDVIKQADSALYEAKKMGRNRYVAFDELAGPN